MHLLNREALTELSETLDSLPNAERQVLQWHYLDGISVGDIEDRMSKSNGAIRGLLQRAKQRFRAALDRHH